MRRHKHGHHHRRAIVTEIAVETTIARVIVFVDENDVPYETTTVGTTTIPPATPAAIPSSSTSVTPVPVPSSSHIVAQDAAVVVSSASSIPVKVSSDTSYGPSYSAVASPSSASETSISAAAVSTPAASSSAAPSSAAVAPAPSGAALPWGIAYSPYTTGACKDASQVLSDFQQIGDEYKVVRIYGTDCQQVENSVAAAKATNKKLIVGIFYVDQTESAVQIISGAVNGDWSIIDLVTVGNEDISKGSHTASDMVDAIGWARSNLTAAGYDGLIGIVDTVQSMLDNPSMCTSSDVALVNAHAFFDSTHESSVAGTTIRSQVSQVEKACVKNGETMRVIVTESGWPKQGQRNGQAIPSIQDQQQAISSLKASFTQDIVFFSAFDANWAQNSAGTFGAEQFWGILDTPSQ